MRTCAVFAVVILAGCGSGSSGNSNPGKDSGPADVGPADVGTPDTRGGDAATDSTPPFMQAAHPPMPQVVDLKGPVLKSPRFVTITFAGDALAPEIDDFAAKVAASKTYWSGTTAEYGVGKVASVVNIKVNETPPASLTDADVRTWLAAHLGGGDAGAPEGGAPDGGGAWPAPDAQTIFMVYYPAGVSISQAAGASCQQFFGYHDNFQLGSGAGVVYSVVARCPPFPGTSQMDSISAIASHELVEAATDPFPSGGPAWAQPDDAHIAWAALAGGELGDMCAAYGNVFYKPADLPYLVQRTWSNKAAAAGHDPCEPAGATPYFNAAAVLNDDVNLGGVATKGVAIPVGATKTIELDLYSDAPTAPWTVQAFDAASLFGQPAELDVSFAGKSKVTGKNGDKLNLSVKVLKRDPSGGELLWIQSTMGMTQTVWIAVVGS